MYQAIKKCRALMVALVLFSTMLLVGCSGGLKSSDVDGYWVVQSSGDSSFEEMLDKGIFTTYYFEGEDTFKLIGRVQDTTLEREGTYKIENNKVIINVPEIPSEQTDDLGPIKSVSGKAIESGEITIDGDTLTAKGVSTDGSEIIAKKITSEQYEEYVAKAEALGPKEIKLGEQVETDLASIKVDSFGYQTEIDPPDTSGYYRYYESTSGTKFLLAKITYTNKGTDYSIPGYAFNASFNVDGNNYSGEILFAADSTLGQSYRVEAKETRMLYAYCSVPNAVADAGGTAKMTLSIPKEQQCMSTYYQASFPSDRFVITK